MYLCGDLIYKARFSHLSEDQLIPIAQCQTVIQEGFILGIVNGDLYGCVQFDAADADRLISGGGCICIRDISAACEKEHWTDKNCAQY